MLFRLNRSVVRTAKFGRVWRSRPNASWWGAIRHKKAPERGSRGNGVEKRQGYRRERTLKPDVHVEHGVGNRAVKFHRDAAVERANDVRRGGAEQDVVAALEGALDRNRRPGA